MMRCNEMLSILALSTLATVAGLLVPPPAVATSSTPLCNSVRGACMLTPPGAPLLRADVCWDGSVVKLENGSCATGSRPYYLEYGEVEPLTGAVIAYAPVADACDQGFCSDAPVPPDTEPESGFICCGSDGNPCSQAPTTQICTVGDLVYCFDYTITADGLTCHDDD